MAELWPLINKPPGTPPQNEGGRGKTLHNQKGARRESKRRVFYALVDNGPAFRALRVHMWAVYSLLK